jgi:hypothetical protein
MTAVLPLLQAADIRAMRQRSHLPTADALATNPRHCFPRLLTVHSEPMNSDWNSKLPHDMQTASGLRREPARIGRLRTTLVKSPLLQIRIMLSPKLGRPEGQERYESGGNKVSRDSRSHGISRPVICGAITTFRTILSAPFISHSLNYLENTKLNPNKNEIYSKPAQETHRTASARKLSGRGHIVPATIFLGGHHE